MKPMSAKDLLTALHDGSRLARAEFDVAIPPGFTDDLLRGQVAAYFGEDYRHSTVVPEIMRDITSNDELRARYTTMSVDQMRLMVWRRNKIVYDIDPDTWADLGTMKPTAKVWTSTFRNIRHPDVFVHFPEFMRFPGIDRDKLDGQFGGMFLQGYKKLPDGQRGAKSLTNDDLDGIALIFVGFTETLDGKPFYCEVDGKQTFVRDVVWNTLTIDFDENPTTVEGLIQKAIDRYIVQGGSDVVFADKEAHITLLIRRVIPLLSYLGTTAVDIERVVKPGSGKKRQAKSSDATTYKVGTRIGTAIRLHKQQRITYERNEQAGDGQGTKRRSPRPYRVAPFVRGYWCKEAGCTCLYKRQDKHIETRLIEGYWASTSHTGEADVMTIIPVKD